MIFLSPVSSQTLLNIHSDFHREFNEYLSDGWQYYLPGNWVPHCTLAINATADMVKRAVDILHGVTLPIEVTVKKIGVLKFAPNANYTTGTVLAFSNSDFLF